MTTAQVVLNSAIHVPAAMSLPVRLSIPGKRQVGAKGFILSFVPGEVSILLNCPLADCMPVTVQFKGTHLDGEILSSFPVTGGYKTNILVYDSEPGSQRRTPRFPVLLPAKIHCGATDAPLDGVVIDISKEGLGLELCGPLSVDATIAIETSSCTTFGLVRHCRQVARNRFRIGVSMVHVMRRMSQRSWGTWLRRRAS